MKISSVFLIVSLIFTFTKSALAADNAGQKLKRGVVNIVTAPVEIAKQIDQEWKAKAEQKKNVTAGVFTGFFKGLAFTVGRFGSGLWDIVSFPFKVPANYEPLMKPEFVLEKPEEKK